ncbi:DUF4038 domain-containing protein [Paenibacillus lignilyticus]|uniref:DUF4038 domain-containing protein n=1 Tax=Paenibacillus lignilyticus TaxID=1172615 RepID=A0ABS5CFJ7_9BACL|nr:DUF4038 domain-containing protein [Paenibacillus lignilyticus]MBP3964629.1 DUF4038 domain-containing protein [Paenibacillus lignilyticus]
MRQVTVAENKEILLDRGQPFFYLADTVWGVFSAAKLEEWEVYLEYRRLQGFNALQISVLPLVHETVADELPFRVGAEGKWDFMSCNEAYFDKAEKMLQMACERGFLPVLVVLWHNYVPGTGVNNMHPEHTIPWEAVEPYTEYVAKRFARYNPLYYISGDTQFENEQVTSYYEKALQTLKRYAPEAVTAMHMGSHQHDIPETILQSEDLDLYIYQSGHRTETQSDCYELPEQFMDKTIRRPILNSEPCYEGHGYGNRYGRYGAFDVRRAFWWSVLGGAKAGFTYGAHGIWSWHRKGTPFNNEDFAKTPFDWRVALRFSGAWDIGYAKELFEQHAMFELVPRNDLLVTPYPEIRVAGSRDLSKMAVYVPYSNDVELALNLTAEGYTVKMIDLDRRNVIRPAVTVSFDEHGASNSRISMSETNTDVLIIALKGDTIR